MGVRANKQQREELTCSVSTSALPVSVMVADRQCGAVTSQWLPLYRSLPATRRPGTSIRPCCLCPYLTGPEQRERRLWRANDFLWIIIAYPSSSASIDWLLCSHTPLTASVAHTCHSEGALVCVLLFTLGWPGAGLRRLAQARTEASRQSCGGSVDWSRIIVIIRRADALSRVRDNRRLWEGLGFSAEAYTARATGAPRCVRCLIGGPAGDVDRSSRR
ncbi:hypothetical protein AOLI_G00294520 [Acnodon oligacanthus]